jgi:hypothetical protein
VKDKSAAGTASHTPVRVRCMLGSKGAPLLGSVGPILKGLGARSWLLILLPAAAVNPARSFLVASSQSSLLLPLSITLPEGRPEVCALMIPAAPGIAEL